MTALNYTAISNAAGFSDVYCAVNNSTDGFLMGAFIIALFFVMLLILKRWDFEKSLMVSSWSMFLISLIPSATYCSDGTRYLSTYYPLIFLIVAALTAIYLWFNAES